MHLYISSIWRAIAFVCLIAFYPLLLCVQAQEEDPNNPPDGFVWGGAVGQRTLNIYDGNRNDTWDLRESGFPPAPEDEDAIVGATLWARGSDAYPSGTITFVIEGSGGPITRAWGDRSRTTPFTSRSFTFNKDSLTEVSFYLEGYALTGNYKTPLITLMYDSGKPDPYNPGKTIIWTKPIKGGVWNASIEVDSNNNGILDLNESEDSIEYSESTIHASVIPSSAGFASGLNLPGAHEAPVCLVPIKVILSRAFSPTDRSMVKLNYNQSIPRLVGDGGHIQHNGEQAGGYRYTPTQAGFRIWSGGRNPNNINDPISPGNFVPSGAEISYDKLGSLNIEYVATAVNNSGIKELQLSVTHLPDHPPEYSDEGELISNPGYASCKDRAKVMAAPLEVRCLNRDNPEANDWNGGTSIGYEPIYAGKTTGDMVSFIARNASSIPSATYSWSAVGPETITGPSGPDKSSWTIHNADEDTSTDWLKWKPGFYTVKCVITYPSGTTYTTGIIQEVGGRTHDVVAIGWINPDGVPLSIDNVDPEIQDTYPYHGVYSNAVFKAMALYHLSMLAAGSTQHPFEENRELTTADKDYILNWMFKHAGNNEPPSSFANEGALEAYMEQLSNYKLFNRFQIRYRVNAQTGKFKSVSVLQQEAIIGDTKDPVLGLYAAGQWGAYNQETGNLNGETYYLQNDGSPTAAAVLIFNTLMSPYRKWNNIGSAIAFSVGNQNDYQLHYQVYPTYYVYERDENGVYHLKTNIPQAEFPKGNFNSNPYYPYEYMGPAPFILDPAHYP